MEKRRRWLIWLVGTVVTLPISYGALIRPVWPWALVASTPTLLAVIGGFIGLRRRDERLFRFALLAPIGLGVLTFFLAPALF